MLLSNSLPAEAFNQLRDEFLVFRLKANARLATVEPLYLIAGTLLAAILLQWSSQLIKALFVEVQDHGLRGASFRLLFRILRSIPPIEAVIQKEQKKVVDKLQSSMEDKRKAWRAELPKAGLGGNATLASLGAIRALDKAWQGKCSGTVYWGGEKYDAHVATVNAAYSMFSHTNPLHPDVFPSTSQFEAEVVCGNMTSGGTESILMAVKTTRDYMLATKGITRPEMVVAVSAHSAYVKAARYFGIRLRRAPVGPDFRASVRHVSSLINSNTIMIVGSAPGFPHGVIDPIEELGRLALRRGVCLHVDLCLGGFVLPFAAKLGYAIPPFDFRVAGVTSVSADVHKYGLGPKGSSVVLYRHHALRRHQFEAVTEWTGGLYISPSAAGSRPGGLLAGAWAAMMSLGEAGYLDATRQIMEASKKVLAGVNAIGGLYVLGDPEMTVIAMGSDEVNIYQVNDVMAAKSWSLNALQHPSSIHICITLQHVGVVDQFLEDLAAAVEEVRKDPSKCEDGMAPIYGAAAKMPDRGTVRDLLVAYMDSTC
eukprot:jgi/Mesen1/8939/ME000552S08445